MYIVKLSGTARYGWSYAVYVDGRYSGSGDFYDTLEDVMLRVQDVLRWRGVE